MHFKRRSFRRPLVIALIVVLLIAAVLAFIANGRPAISIVFPAAGDYAIPAQAPVRITFDRPMNPDSLETAFETVPARSGIFAWAGNTATFTPETPWPRGETITLTVTTGVRTSAGIHPAVPFTWSFRTAPTMLAYLWPAVLSDSSAGADLYALDPVSGDVIRLSDTEFGVLDFSPAPDGLHILLSAPNAQGGADILQLDLLDRSLETLIECGRHLCINAHYDLTGRMIAYADSTDRQILVRLADGQTLKAGEGFFPAWSADGRLLAYDITAAAYLVFNPEDSSRDDFPNDTGEPAAWSPRSAYFIAPEIVQMGAESFASHLIRYSASGLDVLDLTTAPDADDNAPVFSLDGTLIAFARRSLAPESWTPGRQLWVMAADGRDAAALTAAGLYHHTAFAWHPDGAQIAYVRSNQADLNELPEIWLIALDGEPPVRLVIGGFAPAWLP